VEQAPTSTPAVASEPEGLAAIYHGLRSDLQWIRRKEATALQKFIPVIPTCLTWCTSFSNVEFFLKPGTPRRTNYKDLYAGVFSIVLTVLLIGWRAVPVCLLWIVAAYRAYDILVYRSYFLLVKGQQKPPWDRSAVKISRGIVFAVVNSYEIVVAYAIMYLISGHIVQGGCKCNPGLSSPTTAFYFSLVTMFTFGPGDFAPNNDSMRGVMMFQMVTSVLFLIFIIPALISLFSEDRTDREDPIGFLSRFF
jgi:hypothetical protein